MFNNYTESKSFCNTRRVVSKSWFLDRKQTATVHQSIPSHQTHLCLPENCRHNTKNGHTFDRYREENKQIICKIMRLKVLNTRFCYIKSMHRCSLLVPFCNSKVFCFEASICSTKCVINAKSKLSGKFRSLAQCAQVIVSSHFAFCSGLCDFLT